MSESALYPAVKRFLAARGFDVKGEVCGCDLVGTRPAPAPDGEPPADTPPTIAIAELKLTLSLDLILQAVDRLACADEVWLAVPATSRGRDRDARARKLCRLVGLGLLAVHKARGDVEVLAEPAPYRPRPNLRRRRTIMAEHTRRRGDPSPGGTTGIPILTAYRQEALACAARLRSGPLPTRALAETTPRATAILYRNVYGWFERIARGTYRLTPDGHAALLRWPEQPHAPTPGPLPITSPGRADTHPAASPAPPPPPAPASGSG